MPRQKHNGDCTKNARIKIDYRGLKPKVNFSYPDKKNQTGGSMLPYIYLGWVIFLAICALSFSVGVEIGASLMEEENNSSELDLTNYTQYLIYREKHEQEIINQTYQEIVDESLEKEKSFFMRLIGAFEVETFDIGTLIGLLIALIPPPLVYYPFRKRWDSLYPKVNAWGGIKKIKVFKPKEVQEINGKIYCEIPLFKNILLNYEATKDFSEYLDFFEIREHDFRYKTSGKGKGEVNDCLWWARFYFSQKPKNGKLEVIFK